MIAVIRCADRHHGANDRKTTAVYEFTCTSRNEITELPTYDTEDHPYNHTAPHPGSSCICTADFSVWMLGADDKWHEV